MNSIEADAALLLATGGTAKHEVHGGFGLTYV
jgi:hypothetical protein